jgi:hypothetical protein
LLIAGSQDRNTASFQTNNFGQSCLPDPCDNGARLRWVDGSWQEYRNYSSNEATRSLARIATGNVMWPHRNSSTNAEGDGTQLVGRVDGLYAVYGLGLVSGDTITDNTQSPAVVYDVFANTWRTEPVDYIAIRRD